MAKRRSPAVATRPVTTSRRRAAPPPVRQSAGTPLPAIALWEWPLLAALLLAPIGAGALEELPAFCLDLLILLAALLRLKRAPNVAHVIPSAVRIPAGALSALGLLSLATSVYRCATLAAWLHWTCWLVLAVLCAAAVREPGGRDRVIAALLLGSAYVVVRGLQEYLFAAFREGLTSWRTFSTFMNPNLLAAYLESLIPLTLALCLRDARRPVAILTGFLCALQLSTLLVTGSRGGLLALGMGMLCFALVALAHRVRPTRIDLARSCAVLAVTLPLLAVTGGPLAGRIARSRAASRVSTAGAAPAGAAAAGAEAHSNQFRVLTWKSTLRMVRERPLLGFGLGAWRYVHPRYAIAGFTRMAHQSYLQLAAEIGIPGLLAFLALLGVTAFALLRPGSALSGSEGLSARDESPGVSSTAYLLPGLGAGIVAAAAHNLLDYSWYIYGTAAPFWALVGLTWGLSRSARSVSAPALQRDRPSARVGGVVLLVLGVWLALEASYASRAEGIASMARAEGAARIEEAEGLAKTAAALNPLDADPLLLLGRIERVKGRLQDAVEADRKAAERAPTWAIPRYRLGEALAAAGDTAGAVAAYKAGLERDPNSTQLLMALAKVQVAAGRREEARATYARLVAVANGPAGTVTALDQMRDYRPAEAHAFLGSATEEEGRLAEAIDHDREGARLLQARRHDLIAGGLAVMKAAGQFSPEEELRLIELERGLWERLARLYERQGDRAHAAEARANAADVERNKPEL